MTALQQLRRHWGLDWRKMGKEEMKAHLEESLRRISEEQEKLAQRLGAASPEDLEKKFLSGQVRGKEGAAQMHQYTRMCSLVRLAHQAMEELEAPDPDAIEDEFEGTKAY